MTFLNLAKNFRTDEDGAVTVDWVVLTAAVVGLGVAVGSAVWDGTESVSDAVDTELTNAATIDNAFTD